MVLGTRSMPSSQETTTSLTGVPPTMTSCTEDSTASGSTPRLKVRHACGSRSTRSTRRPCSANAAPSEATEVVLATPPFWLARARIVALRFGCFGAIGGPSMGSAGVAPIVSPEVGAGLAGQQEAAERLGRGQQRAPGDPGDADLALGVRVGERQHPDARERG